jgi:hypothetical protein
MRIQKMKIDRQSIPGNTLGLVDKKVLIRPIKAKEKILLPMALVCQFYHARWLLGRFWTKKANKTGGANEHGEPICPNVNVLEVKVVINKRVKGRRLLLINF